MKFDHFQSLPVSISRCICLLIFLIAFAPIASYSQENSKLDTRFLKEEPYRKGKQKVDLSQITSPADMAIIKEAINPMMALMYSLAQIRSDPLWMKEIVTENGLSLLEFPPPRNEFNRYLVSRMYNFHVVDSQTIIFTADHRDFFEEKAPHVNTYIFIKTEGTWKFDRHK